MDRAEGAGLTVALIGHAVLFGVLSVGFLATPNPAELKPQPIEVTLADKVALESTTPAVSTEDQKIDYAPEPAPGAPQPAPARPEPEPEVAKPNPAPPKPAPAPVPNAKPQPPAKPVKAPTSPSTRPEPNRKPSLDLDNMIKNIGGGPKPNTATNPNPPGAVMSREAAANIGSAIQRQVQPCADRQVSPGPGADRIWAVVNLQINRDGSLSSPPRIVRHDGVDDENQRYVTRVDDAVRAIFAGCSPLRGLPLELYDVPNGWKSFTLRYRIKS
ncbi:MULTISPECIES: cell envelope biogenesis protein TolA [unclassified Sphingomonas]|jgi:outer membrane biosynthesis protein TonB|uniref:cell envelope biogenesis protein TolA n=1 Tax=unclassified Sphingomonas TaxID=196159 RepID=UPI000A4EA964|nr:MULTISPECIES: cell envelope biogenesis protein TolA [unclassified Sphingomonas]